MVNFQFCPLKWNIYLQSDQILIIHLVLYFVYLNLFRHQYDEPSNLYRGKKSFLFVCDSQLFKIQAKFTSKVYEKHFEILLKCSFAKVS